MIFYKNVTKALVSIVAALLVIELFPVNVISASDTVAVVTHTDGSTHDFSTIEAAFEDANNNDHSVIKLMEDCAINEQLEVNKKSYFTLDLNGHTIDAQQKDRLIYIDGFTKMGDEEALPGHLVILDSSPNHDGVLKNGYRASGQQGGSGIEVVGQLEFLGGTIKDCKNDGYYDGEGGAIYVEGVSPAQLPGYALMGGNAKIENCSVGGVGGAVYIEKSGHFRMDGGTITNCHADCAGGGVFAFKNASFEFYGGSINDCHANPNCDRGGAYDGCGGGVFIFSGAMIDMKGGEIRNCSAKNGGGLYLYQGFKDMDDTYYYGSQGFLEGGIITNNRAFEHGGGVFVKTGEYGVLNPTMIGRLHLAGSITVDKNQGIEKEDGPILDNVYLDINRSASYEGYRPFFYVDTALTGRVGINTKDLGQISFAQFVEGSQLHTLFSDDNGRKVVYRDNINWLEKAHATIIEAHLITYSSDRVTASVELDRDSRTIRIYANREKDLNSPFEYEEVEIIWVGARLRDDQAKQVYYSSPLPLKYFGPASQFDKSYGGDVTVYDSTSGGGYSETWNIKIFFNNSLDKIIVTARNATVYKLSTMEYSEETYWEKLTPDYKEPNGAGVYKVFYGTRIKAVSDPSPKDSVYYRWRGNQAFYKAIMALGFQRTDPVVEAVVTYRLGFAALYKPIEKEYTVNIVNGYLNNDPSCTSLTLKANETVNATFKAPSGAGDVRFVKWETSGTYKIDDSNVNKENITFSMPAESFTLTGIYKPVPKNTVKYHTFIDDVEDTTKYQEFPNKPEGKEIRVSAPSKIDNNEFIKFTIDESVSYAIRRLDNGDYECIFTMKDYDVNVKAWYKYVPKDYELVQVNTTTSGKTIHSEGETISDITALDKSSLGLSFDGFELSTNGRIITDNDEIDSIIQSGRGTNVITIKMPSYNLVVAAKYKKNQYTLEQINTIDEGIENHYCGDGIYIQALDFPASSGREFEEWKFYDGGNNPIAPEDMLPYINGDLGDMSFTLTMPPFNLIVEASYEYNAYNLTQINTINEGTESHFAGSEVEIKAANIPEKTFTSWKFYRIEASGPVEIIGNDFDSFKTEYIKPLDFDPTANTEFTLTMPEYDLLVEAVFDAAPETMHLLTQVKTENEGDSYYSANTEVNIKALDITGYKFTGWKFYKIESSVPTEITGSDLDTFKANNIKPAGFDILTGTEFTLVMPDYDLKVEATFEPIEVKVPHDLKQIKTVDEGIASYYAGTKVKITANDYGADITFKEWKFYDFNNNPINPSDLEFDPGTVLTSSSIVLHMPDHNLIVEATYNEPPEPEPHKLTLIGTYFEGTSYQYKDDVFAAIRLDVTAPTVFDHWEIYKNDVRLTGADLTNFINNQVIEPSGTLGDENIISMPDYDLTIKAVYKNNDGPVVFHLLEQVYTIDEGTSIRQKDETITVTAITPTSGSGIENNGFKYYKIVEDSWQEIAMSEITHISSSSSSITFKMPDYDLRIVAQFKSATQKYELTSISTSLGDYKSFLKDAGEAVDNVTPVGTGTFKYWVIIDSDTGDKVDLPGVDVSVSSLSFTMPAKNITIMPVFESSDENYYWIDVINGLANGEPYDFNLKDTDLDVKAAEYDGGNFIGWKVYKYQDVTLTTLNWTYSSGDDYEMVDISDNLTELNKLGIDNLAKLNDEDLDIKQPEFDIELVAQYEVKKVHLEVVNGIITSDGSTSKEYDLGHQDTIQANPAPEGKEFSHWEVIEGNPIWINYGQTSSTATVKLVDDVKVEAVYRNKHPRIPPTGVVFKRQ